jgi:hypothetical protein
MGTTVVAATAALAAGCGSGSSHGATTGHSPSATAPSHATPSANGSIGPEGIPLENGPALAPASSSAPGVTVDGIHCSRLEQLAYHIHAHLQVYVDGQPRSIPAGIGMVGRVAEQTANGAFYRARVCYYWLHTHASDGVIHIESPTLRLYTLGEFFDEWGQPLSSSQVASAKGNVTTFVNGRVWTKTPRDVPLLPHSAIQLDVGSPRVPFGPISWAGTTL